MPRRADKTEFPGAEALLPRRLSLPTLRDAVQTCRGCPLYRDATQAVFGEVRAEDFAEVIERAVQDHARRRTTG